MDSQLALAAQRERLQQYIRHVRRQRTPYLTEHEWVGQKVWRRVAIHRFMFGAEPLKEPWDLLVRDSKFHDPKVGAKVFRAFLRKDGVWVANDADTQGMVCLCFKPIPENFTYFVIQKVHFWETSVIVEPVAGEMQELFRMF